MAKRMYGGKPHQVQVDQTMRIKVQADAELAQHLRRPKELHETEGGKGGSILEYPPLGPNFQRVRVRKPEEK